MYLADALCLSVTLLSDVDSEYDFTMTLLEYRNAFDTHG